MVFPPRIRGLALSGFPRHVSVSPMQPLPKNTWMTGNRPPCPPSVELPPRATASGRHAEVAMHDELAARHRAITLRLAGRPVKAICAAVGRSEVWFRKWWGR
jgi:hypothetical protein